MKEQQAEERRVERERGNLIVQERIASALERIADVMEKGKEEEVGVCDWPNELDGRSEELEEREGGGG